MYRLLLSSFLLLPVYSFPFDDQLVLSQGERIWKEQAIEKLWTERKKMAHTPLVQVEIPGVNHSTIFIKNETASASGTLKHRFVWALVMWAVVEGRIKSNTIVYDSTSGNTGASEAYMCRLIGVPYTAVVANELEHEKIKQITQFGGQIKKVNVSQRDFFAEKYAKENEGFFINQFGNADGAEEYHESGNYSQESVNVFHEILLQMKHRNLSAPNYFIHSAGTGGTISSVGKYITRYNIPTQVVLADSEYSLFYDYVLNNKYSNETVNRPKWIAPGIAGIGYGYNPKPIMFKHSTSLLRTVINEVVRMPDIVTMAAMRSLRKKGIDGGASTALNFIVALHKAIENEKKPSGHQSFVLIMGDPGKFYESTYLNNTWVEEKMKAAGGMAAINCWESHIDSAINTGEDFVSTGSADCTIDKLQHTY